MREEEGKALPICLSSWEFAAALLSVSELLDPCEALGSRVALFMYYLESDS